MPQLSIGIKQKITTVSQANNTKVGLQQYNNTKVNNV